VRRLKIAPTDRYREAVLHATETHRNISSVASLDRYFLSAHWKFALSASKQCLVKILFRENFSFIEFASVKYFYGRRAARA
jgi:hypothetical protein